MNDYLTWEYLATYAGTILAVTLITQFIKGVGFIDKIPTRFTSYVVAVVIMIAAMAFTGQLTWSSAALTLINGVVVSLAANGTYDAIATEALTTFIEDAHPPEDEEENEQDDREVGLH